nr:hypothetical protein [Methylobacterium radiotolerans JCM 2831]
MILKRACIIKIYPNKFLQPRELFLEQRMCLVVEIGSVGNQRSTTGWGAGIKLWLTLSRTI